MDISEDRLRQAVDQVIEPVWPAERQRAARQLARSSIGRWAGGVAAIVAFALLLHVVVGLVVPWLFFGFIGLLAAIAALPDPHDRAHLRREGSPPVDGGGRYYRR